MKKGVLFLLAALMAGFAMNTTLHAKTTEAKVKAGVSKHADQAAEAAKKAEAKTTKRAKKEKARLEKEAKKAKERAEKEAKKANARAEKEAAKLKEAAQ